MILLIILLIIGYSVQVSILLQVLYDNKFNDKIEFLLCLIPFPFFIGWFILCCLKEAIKNFRRLPYREK